MDHYINYQGHRVHVVVEGQGEPLVFLHGWPTNASLWQAQIELFKQTHRVIAPDWLGFGQSDKPLEHQYSFTQKKYILDTILSELVEDARAVTLVGHDVGGPPAILWASENEKRVKRLILLNTVLYTLKTKLDAVSEILLSLPITKDLFVSSLGLKLVMYTNTKTRGKVIRERIQKILTPYQNVDRRLKQRTISEPMHIGREQELRSLSQVYAALKVDKHLIIAKEDPLCFAHIKKLSEENSAVPTHYLEHCGHFIPVDQPEALNKILSQILNSSLRV